MTDLLSDILKIIGLIVIVLLIIRCGINEKDERLQKYKLEGIYSNGSDCNPNISDKVTLNATKETGIIISTYAVRDAGTLCVVKLSNNTVITVSMRDIRKVINIEAVDIPNK